MGTIYVLSRNLKNIRVFYLDFFSFLEVKFPMYLNRRVFVMFIYLISESKELGQLLK